MRWIRCTTIFIWSFFSRFTKLAVNRVHANNRLRWIFTATSYIHTIMYGVCKFVLPINRPSVRLPSLCDNACRSDKGIQIDWWHTSSYKFISSFPCMCSTNDLCLISKNKRSITHILTHSSVCHIQFSINKMMRYRFQCIALMYWSALIQFWNMVCW